MKLTKYLPFLLPLFMVGCETTVGLNIDEVVTSYTESLSFTAEGGEDAIEFDLLCDWEASISEDADWLTLNKYSGNSGRNYIDVTAEENKSIEAREAVITIYNDIYKVSKEVTVYQEANDPYITLSNNELEFVKNKSSKSIGVESNTSWEAKCNAEWISLSPTSGSKGKTTMSVSVKENPYEESRTATITIVDNNQTELAKINVKQGCLSAYINLSNNSIAVKFNIPYTLNIESTVTWSAEYDADIVSVTPNSGIGKVDATITIIGQTTDSVDIRFYNNDYSVSTTLHITPDYTNCIFYTTSDGNIVSPYNSNGFGAKIISNEIINGIGAITFNDSITTIVDYAFYDCSSLTSVTIPNSVKWIREGTFAYCSSLTSVTIPDSVTTIGWGAFVDCTSLTSITIPDSVTTIGESAFDGCSSLTSVTIPDSVTTIGDYVFYGCSSLTSITIPDSVTTIGDYAFYGCSSLTSITIPDSLTWIGEAAFYGCSSLTSITIPDSLTSIGEAAFYECSSLTSATIGDSVTTIGMGAFYGCSSLTSVTMGEGVETVGGYAFDNCPNLNAVHITDLAVWCNIDFINPLTDGNVNIAANPLCYAGSLYLNGELVTDLVIPDEVTELRIISFVNCSSLTNVTIPDSVTTIGDLAFYGCSSLTSATIGDSVTTIGSGTFYGCSSLTSATIGDSVTTIGGGAFYDCSSLTSVYCKATTPPTGDSSMFYANASGRKIYVPMESVYKYKSASGWSYYASYIVGYNF